VVAGPRANAGFLAALVSHPEFAAGRFDTGFIDRHLDGLIHADPAAEAGMIAAAVEALLAARAPAPLPHETARHETAWRDPFAADDGFMLTGTRRLDVDLLVDGHARVASVAWQGGGPRVSVDGAAAATDVRIVAIPSGVVALAHGLQRQVALKSYDAIDVDHLDGGGTITAPMHGKVLALLVAQGDTVQKGQRLAVIEAMKMEHALLAPIDGVVGEIAASVGAQVAENARIMTIEEQA
jgi:3-methylcrotonyl-CoA carboxylase alpha subunit